MVAETATEGDADGEDVAGDRGGIEGERIGLPIGSGAEDHRLRGSRSVNGTAAAGTRKATATTSVRQYRSGFMLRSVARRCFRGSWSAGRFRENRGTLKTLGDGHSLPQPGRRGSWRAGRPAGRSRPGRSRPGRSRQGCELVCI